MRTGAEVVIVGGGVFGCSVAAHLAERGQRDLLLLEAGEIGAQTSSQAAGHVQFLRPRDDLTEMARYGLSVFPDFARVTGQDIGFHRSGSLRLGLTPERADEMNRQVAAARRLGVPLEPILPPEAKRLMPLLEMKGILAATFAAGDGYIADPRSVAVGYAARARALGAATEVGIRVGSLVVEGGRVRGVTTERGSVAAGQVVLAAGAWSPGLAALAGFGLPAVPVRHQLQVTGPIPGIAADQPVTRFPDKNVYLRPEPPGLIVGAFEAQPSSFDIRAQPTFDPHTQLEPNLAGLNRYVASILPFVPSLANVPVLRYQKGLPTFTPDHLPLIGPIPGINGLVVACGCCASGIAFAPAVGRLVAELVLGQRPFVDVNPFALDRFGSASADLAALRAACERGYASYYAVDEGTVEQEQRSAVSGRP